MGRLNRFALLAAVAVVLGMVTPALAAQMWTAGAALPNRVEGACTAVIDDHIYVAYGFDPGSGDTRALRIYDIESNTWTMGPQAPAPVRSEGYRGVAHDGKLYCIGGRSAGPLANLNRFDPVTNTWATLASMPDARAGTTAAVKGDDIFVFGGRKGTAPCTGPAVAPTTSTTILRYDIDTNTWSNAGNLQVARSDATAARKGDKIYIFGGCNGATSLASVEVYDPNTETSTLLTATLPGGAREDAAAATAGDDIHITGGGRSGVTAVTPNHLIFDPKSGTFTTGTEMPTHCGTRSRGEHELVAHGGRLFAVAGACPSGGTSINNLDILKLNP